MGKMGTGICLFLAGKMGFHAHALWNFLTFLDRYFPVAK